MSQVRILCCSRFPVQNSFTAAIFMKSEFAIFLAKDAISNINNAPIGALTVPIADRPGLPGFTKRSRLLSLPTNSRPRGRNRDTITRIEPRGSNWSAEGHHLSILTRRCRRRPRAMLYPMPLPPMKRLSGIVIVSFFYLKIFSLTLLY